MNKVSVITVVYNDVVHIRETIESFFLQTWPHKEYIIIDGGSTDGTLDIIKEYSYQLAYWCSEKDRGIYDAMNKGIMKASGDWINILNSGDRFYREDTLETVFSGIDVSGVDVLYGNSAELSGKNERHMEANADVSQLSFTSIYRHGSSFVRREIHQEYLFDLTKHKELKYALDWDLIFTLYTKGFVFKKCDETIEVFEKEGTSNHDFQNLWYNYRIVSRGRFNASITTYYIKQLVKTSIKKMFLFQHFKRFVLEFFPSYILPWIPFWTLRRYYFTAVGAKIGHAAKIERTACIKNGNLFRLGERSLVSSYCKIDAKGYVFVGKDAVLDKGVIIDTVTQDINTKRMIAQKVVIGDMTHIVAYTHINGRMSITP